MPTKKGQTLIEVVVALGILAIVFSGTITLIVNVVNLEFSARKRTEAIAGAQGVLSNTISSIQNSCVTVTPTVPPATTVNGYTYTVTIPTSPGSADFPAAKFLEVNVRVTWENKGLPDGEYKIKQMVRK